jgi:ribonuclease-3 family protein
MNILTPQELEIVRRARNVKGSVPRHRSVSDYRHGTAFEALIGMAYLNQRPERLQLLLEFAHATVSATPEAAMAAQDDTPEEPA